MMKLAPQIVKYRGVVTGLRISAVDALAFVDALDVTSLTPDKGLVLHTGSVTQADSRISAVDGGATASGGAFVDFSAGTNLTDHLGKYLVYKDSAGRELRGWIKGAGTGETVSDLSPSNNSFETDTSSPPTAWNNSTNNVGTAVADGTAPSGSNVLEFSQNNIISAYFLFSSSTTMLINVLLKAQFYAKTISGNTSLRVLPEFPIAGLTSSWTEYTQYYYGSLGSARNGRLALGGTGVCRVDLIRFYKVLTPSSTGCTITSTKNGTTYNWEYKDASFNYNDASGYTYTIYDRDLSAFCDGNHSIEIYDSTGKFLRGVLGSVGSGEELVDVIGGTNPALLNGNFSAWTGDNPNNWIMDFVEDATNYITEATAKANFVSSSVVKFMSVQQACMGAGGLKKLWKITTIIDSITGTLKISERGVGNLATYTTPGTKIVYRNNSGSDRIAFINDTLAVNAIISGLYVQQVTAPSVSGATIVSAKGGATQSFNYKNANFAYNQSSYQVVIKKLRG